MNIERTIEELPLFNQVELLKRSLRGRKSIELLTEFIQENSFDSTSADFVRAHNELADQYRWLKDFDKTASILSMVERRFLYDISVPKNEMIRYKLYKGKLFRSLRQLDSAEYQLWQALELSKMHNLQNTALEGQIWRELGIIYFYYRENTSEGLDYFLKNLQIFQQTLSKWDVNLASLYYELASINRYFGDFERAANFARMSEIIYHNLGDDFDNNELNSLIVQANCLFDDIRFEEASHMYERAIRLFQSSVTPRNNALFAALLNNGTALYNLGRYNKAAENLYSSLAVNPAKSRNDSISLISNYIDLALVSDELGEFEKAEKFLASALEISTLIYDKKHIEISDCYRYFALHFEKRGDLGMALSYHQKSLIAGIKGFDSDNFYKIPSSFDSLAVGSALNMLFDKARVLKKRYSVDCNLINLESAFELYKIAYKLIEDSPESNFMEHSLLNLSENFERELDHGIECVLTLYRSTNDRSYLNSLLQFIEVNKYLLLNSSISKSTYKKTLGIPDSAYQKEKDLLAKINGIKKDIFETQFNSAQEELDRRLDLVHAILEWDDVRRQWSESAKIDSSRFGVLNPITLNQIKDQLLDESDLLLEYFSVGDSLFCLAVGQDFDTIFSQSIDAEFINARDQYLNHLFGKDTIPALDSYETFVDNSYLLYQSLVEPALGKLASGSANLNTSRVIIVPDDLLSIVPFESLIRKRGEPGRVNYFSLDYLCNDFTFNYAYSTNILYDNLISTQQERNRGILAFGYSSANQKMSEISRTQKYAELPYSAIELRNINKWISEGIFFEGDNATEANFKTNVQDFGIIHLALHGTGDTIDMLNSQIIFKDAGDNNEDGILFAHELYGLDLSRSNMAVLSACETGIGKLIQGEGLYSLARGFAYAGCPSLIMSFWKVNDESTAQLMDYFYESLSRGESKDFALRQAKLKFINNSDDINAHPGNWAAFISVGDTRPLQIQKYHSKWYLLVIFIALLMAFYVWRQFQHR